ncbi:MAG: methylated-DNA--[protein]-cysteine S-methyltransferase [Rhodocyclaceae bacterium]|nr:methylated-DNA--[protein]-cysteine S-methyltransferase [Rhodocyclaceae bacterium]
MRTPFGAVGVACPRDSVDRIGFLPPDTPLLAARTPAATRAAHALEAYLADPRYRFDLELTRQGTAFQQRVWQALSAIPVGMLRTYGQLSGELGTAARALGQACGANPHPIVVPCHRVVAAGGPGGFAHAREGYLMDAKLWLLRHEGAML